MDLRAFDAWLDRYFAAWRSNDPDEVAALFAEDAEYSWGPFREPARGREAIVRRWVEGDPQPDLETSFEPLATAGERGIAHWRVSFENENGGTTDLDGILVCDFDPRGRCTLHREWYDRREAPPEAP